MILYIQEVKTSFPLNNPLHRPPADPYLLEVFNFIESFKIMNIFNTFTRNEHNIIILIMNILR